MTRAVLSIGANLGDPVAALERAVDAFRPWLVGVSPIYRTAPWGGIEQDEFRNAVLIVDDADADPQAWLERAQQAERAAGRTREVRWGPRTLDVDVIDVEQCVSEDPALTLPHPHAAQRAFVLLPWLALDPSARLGGVPVAELVAALDPAEVAGVRPDEGMGPR